MKKYLLILAIVFCKLLNAQPPHSFFVIHCDPGYADPIHWNRLNTMIDSATSYNVPLTLELSPQWVNMILSDPIKINQVRNWQQWGHEIAGHHHSIYHCIWDSITNYPMDSILVNQPASSNCVTGVFKDNMQAFWDSLDVITGDSLLLTWGSSDEHPEIDLYPQLKYRTSGGRDTATQGFSNVYVETYGPTTINGTTYGPYTVCLIDYYFLFDNNYVNDMIMVYNDVAFSSQYQAAGVVTHVFNVQPNNTNNFFYQWLRFISGKGCKTVRNIMRAEGCITTNIKNETLSETIVYPNPVQQILYLKNVEGNYYQITSILGEKVREGLLNKNEINVSMLSDGVYFLMLYKQSNDKMNVIHQVKFIKQ